MLWPLTWNNWDGFEGSQHSERAKSWKIAEVYKLRDVPAEKTRGIIMEHAVKVNPNDTFSSETIWTKMTEVTVMGNDMSQRSSV